jgi:hypothetical protein
MAGNNPNEPGKPIPNQPDQQPKPNPNPNPNPGQPQQPR